MSYFGMHPISWALLGAILLLIRLTYKAALTDD